MTLTSPIVEQVNVVFQLILLLHSGIYQGLKGNVFLCCIILTGE